MASPDHPRSRGVYLNSSHDSFSSYGSSPLARGLLAQECEDALGRGIIPARAGFTPGHSPVLAVISDHPRSRGVYGAVNPKIEIVWGSSPLARGLQGKAYQAFSSPGIIPARAGFTSQRMTMI